MPQHNVSVTLTADPTPFNQEIAYLIWWLKTYHDFLEWERIFKLTEENIEKWTQNIEKSSKKQVNI